MPTAYINGCEKIGSINDKLQDRDSIPVGDSHLGILMSFGALTLGRKYYGSSCSTKIESYS